MAGFVVIEASHFGIEITFKDTDGSLIAHANVTSLTWELISLKSGFGSNPVLTGTVDPDANPYTVTINLADVAVDHDVQGYDYAFDASYTYTGILGAGVTGRILPVRISVRQKLLSV